MNTEKITVNINPGEKLLITFNAMIHPDEVEKIAKRIEEQLAKGYALIPPFCGYQIIGKE